MPMSDFSNIHLLPEELKALYRISRMDRIPKDHPYFETFRRLGFITFHGNTPDSRGGFKDGWYLFTSDGRRYLNFLKEQRKSRRVNSRRYWITTGIAIFALLVAILSLFLQVLQARGTIDLSQFLQR